MESGPKLIIDFALQFKIYDQNFVWTKSKLNRLISLILGNSDDPTIHIEWKRCKWLIGLILESDIKIIANCLSSTLQATEFAILLTRLLKTFFYEFIWAYCNERMKNKKDSLNINVKNLALQKKKARLMNKSKRMRRHNPYSRLSTVTDS